MLALDAVSEVLAVTGHGINLLFSVLLSSPCLTPEILLNWLAWTT